VELEAISFVGEERINFPEDTDKEKIRKRIAEWKLTETGSWYETKEENAGRLVFERTWRSSVHYIILCIIILAFSLFPSFVLDGAGLSLRFLIILASNYVLFVFAIVYWVQKFHDFVRLFVHIRNNSVEVRAEGTQKGKTEANLHSIIQTIKTE